MCARTIGDNFFSRLSQTMCKKEFFKLIKSGFKNNPLKYENSEKLSFEISFWVKNGKLILFKKFVLAPKEVIFLNAQPKYAQRRILQVDQNNIGKTSLRTTQRVKN